MKTLCIYHSDCADGFTSAWVVKKAYERDGEEVIFHPGSYAVDKELPVIDDRHVLLVDFSYKRPVMEKIIPWATSVTILDHHKSAKEDLEGLKGLNAVWDMNRSGARITWDFFFPNEAPPPLLLAVEDRDLWRFALRATREAVAALFSYEYDFEVWDYLMKRPIDELAKEGEILERNHFKYIRTFIEKYRRMMKIGGHVVPVANLPENYTSDAANIMSKGFPFAACYSDNAEGRVFSLRSQKDTGIDVSEIAKLYGGGGHRNAAGFRVSFEQAREFEL